MAAWALPAVIVDSGTAAAAAATPVKKHRRLRSGWSSHTSNLLSCDGDLVDWKLILLTGN
jgi:hypothetical protein